MLEIASYSFRGVPLLSLAGDLDHASAAQFNAAVGRALGSDGNRLLLQLTDCPYMDSGGISCLLSLLRRFRPDGWLGVVAPSPGVHRLLNLVGLTLGPNLLVFAGLEGVQAHLGVSPACAVEQVS
jgi:anti-anti-sigma factor